MKGRAKRLHKVLSLAGVIGGVGDAAAPWWRERERSSPSLTVVYHLCEQGSKIVGTCTIKRNRMEKQSKLNSP